VSNDEESLLFINTEDLTTATYANGAFSSLEEQDDITFQVSNNHTGHFSLLLRINEQIEKVLCAEIIQRNGSEAIDLSFASGSDQGITLDGDKIVLNAISSVDLGLLSYDACLVVRYAVKQ
jgi:hypothetical protein